MLPPWFSLLVVAAILESCGAFLPTQLNYSDSDVIASFCPENMSGDNWDHKAITREAIRKEIRKFFMEVPPVANETLYIPEDATLSQIFRYYYGPTSSPARFIKVGMHTLI
ncbi:hypothetical protein SK128_002465 [Halocaridina rubra]|uniref:Uncharacterized protein n=1 Tax=Halocaridina rubra TaxID=373956 RepID=A0AAN8X8J0_HALRR